MTFRQQPITVKLNNKKVAKASLLYLSKDIMEVTGVGRLEFPYNRKLKDMFKPDVKDVVIEGGLSRGQVSKRIFFGKVTIATRHKDILSVSLVDYGVNFTKPCTTTYTDERLEDVLKKLIKEVEFEPVLKNISPEILDKKIGQASTLETPTAGGTVNPISTVSDGISNILGGLVTNATAVATGAINTATGSCVSFTGKPSCSYKCGPYQSVTKSWINKCPNCNKTGTMINKQKKDSPEGQMTCSNCDCDFCINCGREKWIPPHCGGLTPCSGGAPAGGAGTTGTIQTYEDVINQICAENNLYMYLDHYKKCYIQEFRGVTKANYELTPDMIQRSYYKFTNAESGDSAFEVRVKYKNGTVSKFFGAKQDIKEQNIQKYDKPDLDQSKADEFAQTTLFQTLRERKIEMQMRCIASPLIFPGMWLRVPKIENFSVKEILYICGMTAMVRPNEAINYDIILKYAPPMPELKTAAGASSANLASIDAIGAKAATFGYGSGCSDAMCLEAGGSGECYAMSDWLLKKLTAIGVRAQILWCSGPQNHRTVQIDTGSGWQDFDYRKYNIAQNFRVSSNRSGCRPYM